MDLNLVSGTVTDQDVREWIFTTHCSEGVEGPEMFEEQGGAHCGTRERVLKTGDKRES